MISYANTTDAWELSLATRLLLWERAVTSDEYNFLSKMINHRSKVATLGLRAARAFSSAANSNTRAVRWKVINNGSDIVPVTADDAEPSGASAAGKASNSSGFMAAIRRLVGAAPAPRAKSVQPASHEVPIPGASASTVCVARDEAQAEAQRAAQAQAEAQAQAQAKAVAQDLAAALADAEAEARAEAENLAAAFEAEAEALPV